jgi:hypothetical protein
MGGQNAAASSSANPITPPLDTDFPMKEGTESNGIHLIVLPPNRRNMIVLGLANFK